MIAYFINRQLLSNAREKKQTNTAQQCFFRIFVACTFARRLLCIVRNKLGCISLNMTSMQNHFYPVCCMCMSFQHEANAVRNETKENEPKTHSNIKCIANSLTYKDNFCETCPTHFVQSRTFFAICFSPMNRKKRRVTFFLFAVSLCLCASSKEKESTI